MPPSIQELKDKCMMIHHLKKLSKIRTQSKRRENFNFKMLSKRLLMHSLKIYVFIKGRKSG